MLDIQLCSGTSCHLMGCSDLKELVESLPVDIQQKISLTIVSCLGHCEKGPNVKLAETIYHKVTPKLLKELILSKIEK